MPSDLATAIRETTLDRTEKPGAFDAVVIGAGAAGGLAAERLTQGGLKVLLLDAGFRPPFLHAPFQRLIAGAVSRFANPGLLPFLTPRMLYRGRKLLRLAGRLRQPIQTECYAWERRPDAFVDDVDCPYTTASEKPFLWIRARALKGRVGIPGHGRQYLRFGRDDFMPPDGQSPFWPFEPQELDPWYSDVEKRLGLSGTQDGLSWLPDSDITHNLTPSLPEAELMALIRRQWPGSHPVLGRYAPPAGTLEGAAKTGHFALRQGAIVRKIEVEHGRAKAVHWFDRADKSERKVSAPLIFLCASALESTRILMLSQDTASGRSIGTESDALGRYLMDHVMIKAEGVGKALPDSTTVEDGRCVYLPRFDARNSNTPKAGRGYGIQLYQTGMGQNNSFFTAVAFSEMTPRSENRVSLHQQKVDRWGIPILHIDCAYDGPERARATDQTAALKSIADAAGVSLSRLDKIPPPPGSAVHECGTARMGHDPATSVLDPHNQCWDAKGLYVTDSASFPSQGSQNPTLTVMALTARACAHALHKT